MAKLKIIRCKIQSGKIEPQSGPANTFEAVINPESYSHSFGLNYSGGKSSRRRSLSRSAATPRYSTPQPQELSFTIVLDGTGVVPDPKKQSVSDQITQLRRVAYDYDGNEHEPTPVKIIWGKGLKAFFGRLVRMKVDYTLFHPDGSALRAKVALSLIEAVTDKQEALQAKNRSPDLTHVVRVREGDTLPLLCYRVYNDATKYLEIARFNDLDGFRDLMPDTLLRFPPMR
ncbi:LysM peptidoglycan-binding domain-containing protein [Paracoccus marinaquae]|uniref:Peptidoglycan-binding protein n=1 Tax=Paracoccus marinaquae TaxID=2841926 RepID=A0ABS6AHN7_9RHOB|nr:peptidoglycan-binding protein [Paracoccus marinaquae]MBU3030118.1 peptidoglycan-binding protein [Paracoccus marinaquae]